jgi:DNA-binding transcriptional LysR family regulator
MSTFLADDQSPQVGDDWLGVELRHLAAVAAVAEEGSFRGAARRLAYVQSSISHQVAQLERLVGLRLIERSRGAGSVTLTEAGERLLEHSHVILTRFKAAQADLMALAEGASVTVRVGVYQSAATRLMPAILPAFARAWPQARVTTVEAATDAGLFGLVEDGALDFAFVDLPVEPGPFEARNLLRDPYALIVPSASPLARLGRPPTWNDVARVPLIVHKSARYLGQIEAQMRSQGVVPRFAYRSDIDAAVQAMVGVHGAAALLPRLAMDATGDGTEPVDLSGLVPPRIVALIWHGDRHLPPAMAGFRDVTARVCDRLGQADDGACPSEVPARG